MAWMTWTSGSPHPLQDERECSPDIGKCLRCGGVIKVWQPYEIGRRRAPFHPNCYEIDETERMKEERERKRNRELELGERKPVNIPNITTDHSLPHLRGTDCKRPSKVMSEFAAGNSIEIIGDDWCDRRYGHLYARTEPVRIHFRRASTSSVDMNFYDADGQLVYETYAHLGFKSDFSSSLFDGILDMSKSMRDTDFMARLIEAKFREHLAFHGRTRELMHRLFLEALFPKHRKRNDLFNRNHNRYFKEKYKPN